MDENAGVRLRNKEIDSPGQPEADSYHVRRGGPRPLPQEAYHQPFRTQRLDSASHPFNNSGAIERPF